MRVIVEILEDFKYVYTSMKYTGKYYSGKYEYEYDDKGNVIVEKIYSNNDISIITEYSYDDKGNLIEINDTYDEEDKSFNNIYDKNNNLVRVYDSKFESFTDMAYNSNGEKVSYQMSADKVVTFDTVKGETYYITGFEKVMRPEKPENLEFERISSAEFKLNWTPVEGAGKYNVYVAYENDASYTFVGSTAKNTFDLLAEEGKQNARKTFVVTAVKNGVESKRAICYSNPINLELEFNSLSWKIEDEKIIVTAIGNESIKSTRLYAKFEGGSKYALVAEASGCVVQAPYDSRKTYALAGYQNYCIGILIR